MRFDDLSFEILNEMEAAAFDEPDPEKILDLDALLRRHGLSLKDAADFLQARRARG